MKKLWYYWDRLAEKVVWGRPFKEKLTATHKPTLHPPTGINRVRRGLVAFDSEIEELRKWTFVLELPIGCFYLKVNEIEALLDKVKFVFQPLTPRYRLDTKGMKLHVFDAKGEIFASKACDAGFLGRNWQLFLHYKITD